MTIEEDKTFLKMQWQKGRPGYMISVDQELTKREARKREREEVAKMRTKRQKQVQEGSSTFIHHF